MIAIEKERGRRTKYAPCTAGLLGLLNPCGVVVAVVVSKAGVYSMVVFNIIHGLARLSGAVKGAPKECAKSARLMNDSEPGHT